jgi:hypothetical protein
MMAADFNPGAVMAYWRYDTSKGAFIIAERSTKGVDLYFGESVIGHYSTPRDAAIAAGNGDHFALPCAPDDGKSLGVPPAASAWKFVAV